MMPSYCCRIHFLHRLEVCLFQQAVHKPESPANSWQLDGHRNLGKGHQQMVGLGYHFLGDVNLISVGWHTLFFKNLPWESARDEQYRDIIHFSTIEWPTFWLTFLNNRLALGWKLMPYSRVSLIQILDTPVWRFSHADWQHGQSMMYIVHTYSPLFWSSAHQYFWGRAKPKTK